MRSAILSAANMAVPEPIFDWPTKRISHQQSLYFLHVPKSAGSSFTSVLRRYLGCDPRPCVASPRPMPCLQLINCYGHRVATEREYHYSVTILREPVARVISAYKHANREYERKTGHCCGIHKDVLNWLPEFDLLSFANHSRVRNQQAKMLAGIETYDLFEGHYSDHEIVERAKRKIDEMDLVGLTEDWNRTVLLFYYILGSSPAPEDFAVKTRTGSGEEAVSEGLMRAIEQTQELDIAVYEYAERVFKKKWQEALERTLNARRNWVMWPREEDDKRRTGRRRH